MTVNNAPQPNVGSVADINVAGSFTARSLLPPLAVNGMFAGVVGTFFVLHLTHPAMESPRVAANAAALLWALFSAVWLHASLSERRVAARTRSRLLSDIALRSLVIAEQPAPDQRLLWTWFPPMAVHAVFGLIVAIYVFIGGSYPYLKVASQLGQWFFTAVWVVISVGWVLMARRERRERRRAHAREREDRLEQLRRNSIHYSAVAASGKE